jgi:tetratricopeptide (TPR) repeat protein
MSRLRRASGFAALLSVAAGLAVYWPALDGGFVWDDRNALRQSATIVSAYDVLVPPPEIPRFYYRPVVFLSYIIDAWVVGRDNPYWFHVSSVALHLLNTLLVFFLARRWFKDDLVVVAGGALLFAVFPTHVESVAWISGKSDVIMTTFLLTATLLHLDGRVWTAWTGAVALLLALLSKETAVAGIVLLPALDWAEGRRFEPRRLLPPLAATAAYFLLRKVGVGAFLGGLPQEESTLHLGLDFVRALGFYITQAFLPFTLNPYYADVPQNVLYMLIGIVAPPAAAGIALLWRGRNRRAATQVALLCLTLWFFLTLAPTLYVIGRRSAVNLLADRYLYAPSAASCIAIAWLTRAAAQRLGAEAAGAAVAVATLALFFGAQARAYVPVWADDISLWTEAAKRAPDAALPHRELATALLVAERIDEAEAAFQAALQRTPDLEGKVMIYSNLGNLYRRKSQYARAVDSFKKGIAIAPHPALFHNLGMTEIALAQRADMASEHQLAATHVQQAREAFERALQMGDTPGSEEAFFQWSPAKTHSLLGQVLFSLGDRDGARRHLETALSLEPSGPVADLTRQYMQRLQ